MPGYLKDLTLILSHKERRHGFKKARVVKQFVSLFLIFLQLIFPTLTLLTTASYLTSPVLAQVPPSATPTPTPSSSSPSTTTFFYDSDGALVYMEERGNETIIGNLHSGALLKTTYIFGTYEENYTPGNSNPTTKRLTLPLTSNTSIVKDNSTTYLISKDYLGSTRAIVKDDGTTIPSSSSLSYYPYGTAYNSQLTTNNTQPFDSTQGKLPTDRLYTGQRKLTSYNLYYYNSRFYSPSLGTFIQPDTVQGINRYAYVGNNPVMNNDPSGQAEKDPFGEGTKGVNTSLTYTPPLLTNVSAEISATQMINPYIADRDIPPGLIDAENFIFATSVGGVGLLYALPYLASAYLSNPVAASQALLWVTLAVPTTIAGGEKIQKGIETGDVPMVIQGGFTTYIGALFGAQGISVGKSAFTRPEINSATGKEVWYHYTSEEGADAIRTSQQLGKTGSTLYLTNIAPSQLKPANISSIFLPTRLLSRGIETIGLPQGSISNYFRVEAAQGTFQRPISFITVNNAPGSVVSERILLSDPYITIRGPFSRTGQ